MNNQNGNKESKYQRPFKTCGGVIGNVSPDNEGDCFRLLTEKQHPSSKRQGDILADANYIVYTNICNDSQQMDGNQLFFYLQSMFHTLFIPRVLMRCTIIPV